MLVSVSSIDDSNRLIDSSASQVIEKKRRFSVHSHETVNTSALDSESEVSNEL